MHHLGYDALATDIPAIVDGVLSHNLAANTPVAPSPSAPTLHARALDWFAPPSTWDFSLPSITPPHPSACPTDPPPTPHPRPPFDLILTSDTAYDPSLSSPLLRTLHHLATLSAAATPSGRPPPVLLALEVRDPALIGAFLESARGEWGFKCSRVENGRLERLMGEGGVGWAGEEWEGVEVWRLVLGRGKRGKGRGGGADAGDNT